MFQVEEQRECACFGVCLVLGSEGGGSVRKGYIFDLSDCMVLFIRAGMAGGRWEGREPWVECLTC